MRGVALTEPVEIRQLFLHRKVLVDRRNINLEQIDAGLAGNLKRYQNEQPVEDRARYATEDGARAARRGLWVDPMRSSHGNGAYRTNEEAANFENSRECLSLHS